MRNENVETAVLSSKKHPRLSSCETVFVHVAVLAVFLKYFQFQTNYRRNGEMRFLNVTRRYQRDEDSKNNSFC